MSACTITVVGFTTHVGILADPCLPCDGVLDDALPDAPAMGSGHRVAQTECSTHRWSARATDRNGGLVVTVRAFVARDDSPLRRATYYAAHRDGLRVMKRVHETLTAALADRPVDTPGLAGVVEDAALWALSGLTAYERLKWVEAGFTGPDVARHWKNYDFSAPDAGRWVAAGVDNPAHADWWHRAGKDRPVSGFEGHSPFHWVFACLSGGPLTPEWGSLAQVASPGFARIGHRQGQPMEAIRALATALTETDDPVPAGYRRFVEYHEHEGISFVGEWGTDRMTRFEAFANELDGLDWRVVAAALRLGMKPHEARRAAAGGDGATLRAMAALL